MMLGQRLDQSKAPTTASSAARVVRSPAPYTGRYKKVAQLRGCVIEEPALVVSHV